MFFPRRPMTPMNSMNQPNMFPRQFGFPPQMMQGGMQGGIQGGLQGGRQGLGGILRRLLPGMGGQANPLQGMGGMGGFMNTMQGLNQGGGALQGLANPSNLSSMIGNVQKTLKMAESVVPMVQQYGPLVKNIPSMIKMYNAIKSSDNNEDESTEAIDISDITGTEDDTDTDTNTDTSESKQKPKAKSQGTGQSVPKLYI